MPNPTSRVLMGILIGGRGTRLGGTQKALLRPPGAAPGDTLVDRLVRLGRAAGLDVVLVGKADLGGAALGVPQLPDAERDAGPLGGLQSLLAHAGSRRAIAVACDMPYLELDLVRRLLHEAPQAALLAPRDERTGKWQPLFARYDAALLWSQLREAWLAGERSFQQFFRRVDACVLDLSEPERAQLRDWDTPEDIAGGA